MQKRRYVIAIRIILPTAFIRHTDGQKQLTSQAKDLPGLIAEIDESFPALSTQIKDESGKLRRFINVYVNEEDIRFLGGDTYTFADGDEVMLIPSIAGKVSADSIRRATLQDGAASYGMTQCPLYARV